MTRTVRASMPTRWIQLIWNTVLATQAIANVVKSSFGPSGLDKMMVDDIGVSFRALVAICRQLMFSRMLQ